MTGTPDIPAHRVDRPRGGGPVGPRITPATTGGGRDLFATIGIRALAATA
ncbi:hypothetical protein ACLQ28_33085 [Micromonospora sp. DT201]